MCFGGALDGKTEALSFKGIRSRNQQIRFVDDNELKNCLAHLSSLCRILIISGVGKNEKYAVNMDYKNLFLDYCKQLPQLTQGLRRAVSNARS
jgi:hypothetical protein